MICDICECRSDLLKGWRSDKAAVWSPLLKISSDKWMLEEKRPYLLMQAPNEKESGQEMGDLILRKRTVETFEIAVSSPLRYFESAPEAFITHILEGLPDLLKCWKADK
ncbi:unnamed protein product [Thelazia callipaeda]|uniref:Uncharacterized protein n=1 Tax=Thelazia callipaeda TaxID=103827 RepID=A0A0N5DC46_THECL|nr:unnamed protein product [Thelazia callipaeda]